MNVTIITSCTGEKAVTSPSELTMADFMRGSAHVRQREQELASLMCPAGTLYIGEQHKRLMKGVLSARSRGISIDVRILSAGYGFVKENQLLAPYNATFNGMRKGELAAWAESLAVHADLLKILAMPADLVLILLGEKYQRACRLDLVPSLLTRIVALTGAAAARNISEAIQPVVLKEGHTRQFNAGLIGLKGECARRILEKVHLGTDEAIELLFEE